MCLFLYNSGNDFETLFELREDNFQVSACCTWFQTDKLLEATFSSSPIQVLRTIQEARQEVGVRGVDLGAHQKKTFALIKVQTTILPTAKYISYVIFNVNINT